jgi:hypothetical protein
VAGRIGAVLVMGSGIGMVVAALARQDCSDFAGACRAAEEAGTLSGHHVLHQLVSLAVFTLLTAALFVLARGLKCSGTWVRLAELTRLAGLVAFLLVAALVTVGYGDAAGLVQRFFVLLVFGWPGLLAAARPGGDKSTTVAGPQGSATSSTDALARAAGYGAGSGRTTAASVPAKVRSWRTWLGVRQRRFHRPGRQRGDLAR